MNLKNKFSSKSSQLRIGSQEARIRNDRQAVFQVVWDLVQAQFARGDEELTKRLWQDVADRKIDLDRVINLMYTCSFHEDDEEMTNVDETYQKTGLVGWIDFYGVCFCLVFKPKPPPSSSRTKAININYLFPSPAVTFIFVDSGFFVSNTLM